MTIEPPSRGFMLAILVASLAAHGLLAAAFAVSAMSLALGSSAALATGSLAYGILMMTGLPFLLSGYFRAGNVASAEVARVVTWLFYGEWVPR